MLEVIKKRLFLFFLSVAILTASFTFNVFGVQSIDWFTNFQKDSAALVVHKLACQDELGKDSYGGMLLYAKNPEKFSVDQKVPVCQKAISAAYVSQYGLQGKISTIAYNATDSFLSLRHFLVLMQFAWALFTAAVLALFIVWIADRFGRTSAVTTLILLSISVWIVGFARNLYWATPFLFMPFIFTLYYYTKPALRKRYLFFLGTLVLLFFVRFLNGFEYTSAIILAPVAAIGYLAYDRTRSLITFAKESAYVCLAGVAAFVAAFGLNYYQVYRYVGDASKAYELVKERVLVRTTGSGSYGTYVYGGLNYTLPSVYSSVDNYIDLNQAAERHPVVLTSLLSLLNYALLPVVNIPVSFKEPFYTIVNSFVALAALAWAAIHSLRKKADKTASLQYAALYRALLVGFIGSISWMVLARSHSYVHAHINGIVYYLPFMLFAYVAIGLWLEKWFLALRLKLQAQNKRGRV